MTQSPETVRLDVWLWRARFFKTRARATAHITAKGVRLSRNMQTRKVVKPGTTIAVGDILTFSRGGPIQTMEVLDLGVRRGPAIEASALYRTMGDAG